MSNNSKKLDEYEIKAILDAQIHSAMGWVGGELTEQRQLAMEYYLGEPFGNEVEGRSKVVSTDVADTIEWILPSLMKSFTASENAVRFDPVGPEDEEGADQATDYVNHAFYKDNEGFLIFYTWFKDALLQKNGIVKTYWDESEKVTRETYENLSEEEFLFLSQDDELTPIEHDEVIEEQTVDTPEGQALTQATRYHNVVFTRKRKMGRVVIENVPPEEFLITKTHRTLSLDDANFVAHRVDKTVSELIDMGYPRDVVEKLPSADEVETEEEEARYHLDDERHDINLRTDDATKRVTIHECYIRMDVDGDGRAELRKITYAGRHEILDNEEVDTIPFDSLTPVILTHKFFGLSIADLVMDLQLLKSSIWRQIVDNLFLQNNQRTAIDQNRVNLDDILTSRPGGIVRVNGAPGNALMPFDNQMIGQSAYQMLEYVDKVREGRTGVSQNTTGLNADLLNNNKGDRSVNKMMSAAEQRIELIARIFAETGVKSLFLRIYELLMKHQDKERVIKMRNEWVTVNPKGWRDRTDMTVAVGLGTGERDRLLAASMQILDLQKTMIEGGGLNILVSPKNVYQAAIDAVKYAGIKNASPYFTDPESESAQQEKAKQEQQEQAQQQAGQTDPTQQLLQLQAQVEQGKLELKAQENQVKAQRDAIDLERKGKDLELKELKIRLDDARKMDAEETKRMQILKEVQERLTELELQYQQNVPGSAV